MNCVVMKFLVTRDNNVGVYGSYAVQEDVIEYILLFRASYSTNRWKTKKGETLNRRLYQFKRLYVRKEISLCQNFLFRLAWKLWPYLKRS